MKEIRKRYDAAVESYLAAGGCARCRGRLTERRNVSDTLDYTDIQTFPCSACVQGCRECARGHGPCQEHLAGRPGGVPLTQWPAYLEAKAFEESFVPRTGRWARSLTTRGKAHGLEGVIVRWDTGTAQRSVLIADGVGRAAWVSDTRVIVDPDRRVDAAKLWLTLPKTIREFTQIVSMLGLHSGGHAPELAEALADDIAVNRDRVLSIDATAAVPDEERVRWVGQDDEGRWWVTGPVKEGRNLAVNKAGKTSWVDVDAIEMRRFHGRKAIKCGRVANKI